MSIHRYFCINELHYIRMSTKKIRYSILVASFCVCLFMLVDHYLVSSSTEEQIIQRVEKLRSVRRGYSGFPSYAVETDRKKFNVSEKVYDRVDAGDTVTIFSSVLSQANQKTKLKYNGSYYHYNLGFTGAVIITITLLTLVVGIIAFMILYNKLKYAPGRSNLTVFISVAVLAILYFHLQ